jgi:hypothetical protein
MQPPTIGYRIPKSSVILVLNIGGLLPHSFVVAGLLPG